MQKFNLFCFTHGGIYVPLRVASLYVSVSFIVYSVYSVKYLISFLECELHCLQQHSSAVDQLRALSTAFVKRLNWLCFKFYVPSRCVCVCLCACLSAVYVLSMYNPYIIYVSGVYDFAVLFFLLVRWKCVNVITTLLFATQTIGSEVKHKSFASLWIFFIIRLSPSTNYAYEKSLWVEWGGMGWGGGTTLF